MKIYRYILLMCVALLVMGCLSLDLDIEEKTTNPLTGTVEVLEDGRLRVATSLERLGMTSVETRTNATEDNIYNGWCMVFGKTNGGTNLVVDDKVGGYGYGDDSPLIQVAPITANANGLFYITFTPFDDIAYMRIVVNLTDRENKALENIVSWQDIAESVGGSTAETPTHTDVVKYRDDSSYNLATFGQYRHQSVGLNGIYNVTYNTTVELVYLTTAVQDYSGEYVNWTVNYQNTDDNKTSGYNYITKAAETYNGNAPDPTSQLNATKGFPMSSYGFGMENLSEETLADNFGTTIDMIRVCSKVVVDASQSNNFEMQEVYVVDAAQESRIRSTVMSSVTDGGTTGNTAVETEFSLPVDLGGTVTYKAMTTIADDVSSPVYFYPNSGGDYTYTGSVDQTINPQYVVIKGQAYGFDEPGYYKVALKAQYPLVENPSSDKTTSDWSALTYDILRNTSFTVNITEVDKPGYKTLADAVDPNNPANNISYSITIEADDNRYEILVSKGTYYVELETSRVYVKGYMTEGIEGCYLDFTMHPSDSNIVPTVYIQSSDFTGDYTSTNVEVTHCLVLREGDAGFATNDWDSATPVALTNNDTGDGLSAQLVKIESSDTTTKVRVFYDVINSGRIRLRMGDILKFIPVTYDSAPISYLGTGYSNSVVVTGNYGTVWDDFSYEDIVYDYSHTTNQVDGFVLNDNGSVTYSNANNYTTKPELRARIYPADAGDGIAVLYLRQASDFKLVMPGGEEYLESTEGSYSVDFTAQGNVWDNNTAGLFSGVQGDTCIIFDTRAVDSESVDPLTISINTEATGDALIYQDDLFFTAYLEYDDQMLTLAVNEMDYSNQAYASRDDITNEITYNYTAKSTITVQNAAGDSKEYIVNQTQYPPIYIVADNANEKSFNVGSKPTNQTDEEVCVYAIMIYGSEYDENTCTVSSEWVKASSTGSTYYGYFLDLMYEAVLSSTYLQYYSAKKENKFQFLGFYTYDRLTNYSYKARRIDPDNNGEVTWTTLAELNMLSSMDYEAVACYALIRNYYNSSINGDVEVTATITVVDAYGETYTSVKEFVGLE
ncbi:MAG: hypothetical protein R3Y59_03785 [bacterium]